MKDRIAAWWQDRRDGYRDRRAARRLQRETAALNSPPALERALQLALGALTMITLVSSAGAFAGSYWGLLVWALHHDVPAPIAWFWPAFVDCFTVAGELAVFIGTVQQRRGWWRVWPWLVIMIGLGASVAGNVGHIGVAMWEDRLTNAVPPVAAFAGLIIALGVLKGTIMARSSRRRGDVLADVDDRRADVDDRRADVDDRRADVGDQGADVPSSGTEIVRRLLARGITDTDTLTAISGVGERHAQRVRAGTLMPAPSLPTSRPPAHRSGSPRLTSVGGGGDA